MFNANTVVFVGETISLGRSVSIQKPPLITSGMVKHVYQKVTLLYREHPPTKKTFSLQNGWPLMRWTNVSLLSRKYNTEWMCSESS